MEADPGRARNRLQMLRDQSGLTQEEAAAKLGVSVHAYRKYEGGQRKLTVERARAAADLFGVSVDYLLAPIGEEPRLQAPPARVAASQQPIAADVIEAAKALLRVSPQMRPFVHALVVELEAQDAAKRKE